LRPLVDDLKILWNPGVLEVWDEYKHEEFTMHGMLFTTINNNPAQRNVSGQSKRKGQLAHTAWKILAQYGQDIQRNTYL
jgi:hypothetical protein